MRYTVAGAVLAVAILGAEMPARAQMVSDLALCADERVKTALLPADEMAKAQAACTRVLEG
ncbi:MAG: hypothetical protein WBF87_14040, partial [Mesorhizobium sp.]